MWEYIVKTVERRWNGFYIKNWIIRLTKIRQYWYKKRIVFQILFRIYEYVTWLVCQGDGSPKYQNLTYERQLTEIRRYCCKNVCISNTIPNLHLNFMPCESRLRFLENILAQLHLMRTVIYWNRRPLGEKQMNSHVFWHYLNVSTNDRPCMFVLWINLWRLIYLDTITTISCPYNDPIMTISWPYPGPIKTLSWYYDNPVTIHAPITIKSRPYHDPIKIISRLSHYTISNISQSYRNPITTIYCDSISTISRSNHINITIISITINVI